VELNWRHALPGAQLDSVRDFLAENGGIYLWIYGRPPGGVHYIGESNRFLTRLTQHFSAIVSGFYETFNVEELEKLSPAGYAQALNGHSAGERGGELIYTPDPALLSKTFFDDVWGARHREYLNRLIFAFATLEDVDPPLDHDTDMPLLRKEIEAVLILTLKKNLGLARKAPIGAPSRRPAASYRITHGGRAVWSVPEEIQKITDWGAL